MAKRVQIALVMFAVLLGVGGFLRLRASQDQADPYVESVIDRFDDGEIMDNEQATCVGEAVRDDIDWDKIEASGITGESLFDTDTEFSDRFSESDTTALISAIDECRGADEVVLAIFASQLLMEPDQLGCYSDLMTEESSKDLLRLILADAEEEFKDREGAVLVGLCGKGIS